MSNYRALLIAGLLLLVASCKSKSSKTSKPANIAPPLEFEEATKEADKPLRFETNRGYAMTSWSKAHTELGRPGKGIEILPTPGEYALVPGDGRLYAAPRASAHRFFRGRQTLASAFPAKVIKTDPRWTELELVTSPRAKDTSAITRCYELPDAIGELKLRVFARTQTLLYTVAQKVVQTYTDSTWVGLAPGVAMQQTRGPLGTYHAGTATALVTVSVVATAVRRSFAPPAGVATWPSSEQPKGGKPLEPRLITPPTDGLIDGAKAARFRHSEDGSFEGYPTRMWSHAKGILIELEQPCHALRALVDAKQLTNAQLGYGEGFPGDHGPSIPKDTIVLWPDGTRAGVATGAVKLRKGTEIVSGRRCRRLYFDWDNGPSAVGSASNGKPMILCVDQGE